MTPSFQISANNKDITQKIKDRLLSLELHDEVGIYSDSLILRLDNRAPYFSLPKTGAVLDVSLGYNETGLIYKGQFKVDALELYAPPETLIIRAHAADFKDSFKELKTRSFEQISLAKLIEQIAASHGYKAVINSELAKHTFNHIDQTQESDLHLLSRLARDLGATIKPIAGKLIVVPLGEARSATGQTLPSISLNKTQVKSYRLGINERGQFQRVNARWYDYKTGQEHEINIGIDGPVFPLRKVFADEASAKLGAQAKLRAFNIGQRELSLDLMGNASIFAESPIIIESIHPEITGSWLVTSTDHRLSNSGFTTNLVAKTLE